MGDLWMDVGNKCLEKASALLEDEAAPTAETAGAVRELVKTAIEIDLLNLRWAQQSRSGAAVFREKPFLPQAKEN